MWKTPRGIQMIEVVYLLQTCVSSGIRWITTNLICVCRRYWDIEIINGTEEESIPSIAIGFNCILTMSTKTVLSKLRGTTLALYILTLSRNSRFEFIFTNLAQSNARKFSSVFDVYRSYQSTLLYRELKLRSAIMTTGHLKLLPKEQVYSTFGGIWNLSSDQGNLGTLIATNVRVIWYADINETFNISLPHMQIATVCRRNCHWMICHLYI